MLVVVTYYNEGSPGWLKVEASGVSPSALAAVCQPSQAGSGECGLISRTSRGICFWADLSSLCLPYSHTYADLPSMSEEVA